MIPNSPIRAVLDCMLFLQGAARPEGVAGACITLADAGLVQLCLSRDVVDEVRDVLSRAEVRRKFRSLTDDLVAQYNALVAAGSSGSLLREYSALLRFWRFNRDTVMKGLPDQGRHSEGARVARSISDEQLRGASLSEIEGLVNREDISRRELEHIAIQRFSVPRGSMRSFSNRQMLLEKLHTLIGNERTHETISSVARGEARPTPVSEKKTSE